MFDLLFILFFSNTTLLTSNYVNVTSKTEGYTIDLYEPISAITPGASIHIDVTNMLEPFSKGDLFKVRSAVLEQFKVGSIKVLLGEGSGAINLIYKGISVISNDRVSLSLSGDNIPTGVNFSKLVINTEINLEKIKIYWKNHKK